MTEEWPYNLLFRWCVGLDLDALVWEVIVFTKNRVRLLAGAVARAFCEQVLAQATAHRLLSDEHVMVDGTLIEAWAGQKSFKLKTTAAPVPPTDDPGNPRVDVRAERRTHAAQVSTTDPEGREAALALVDTRPATRRITLGGEKTDDTTSLSGSAGIADHAPCGPAHDEPCQCQ